MPPLPSHEALKTSHWEVVIVGGGAAGLMAAHAAATRGRRTLLLEKNRKLGVKILMSGGTRCNITHHCSPREIARQFRHAERFLYKALGRLPPEEVVRIVEAEGVATKVEKTGKVFPVSDRAIDVRDALVRRAERAGAVLASDIPVLGVNRNDAGGFRVRTAERELECQSLILTTGGKSYAGCGTTGDGYVWAKALGHSIQPLHPALTPLTTDDEWVRELSGISLESVRLSCRQSSKPNILDSRTGAMLFTHHGLSGPEPMNVSRFVSDESVHADILEIDFVPDVSEELLTRQWTDAARGKHAVASQLSGLLPGRLAETLMRLADIPAGARLASFPANQRKRLIQLLKHCAVNVSGTRGYDKAEVTAGGVTLAEIDPQTMQSRLVPGLYFAGEILDIDGPIGGFNFQAAFSTGTLAASHA